VLSQAGAQRWIQKNLAKAVVVWKKIQQHKSLKEIKRNREFWVAGDKGNILFRSFPNTSLQPYHYNSLFCLALVLTCWVILKSEGRSAVFICKLLREERHCSLYYNVNRALVWQLVCYTVSTKSAAKWCFRGQYSFYLLLHTRMQVTRKV